MHSSSSAAEHCTARDHAAVAATRGVTYWCDFMIGITMLLVLAPTLAEGQSSLTVSRSRDTRLKYLSFKTSHQSFTQGSGARIEGPQVHT